MNRRSALVSSFLLLLLGALALPAVAPAAKLKLRIAKPTVRTVIPDSNPSSYFDYSQSFSTSCRGKELALSPGIVDSSRHIASQSFGPSAISGFTVGLKGRVNTKLQIVCARGAKITHRRKETKMTGGGSTTSFNFAGTSGCGKKGIAIGAPLSQDFSPGIGRFLSRPTKSGGWEVRVENVGSTFPFDSAVPAYVDHACVPRKNLGQVSIEVGKTNALMTANTAKVNVICKGARRAIGWGVDLRPLPRITHSAGKDGWGIPFMRKAQIAGKRVEFVFERPPGISVSNTYVVGQTAYVVCGVPR